MKLRICLLLIIEAGLYGGCFPRGYPVWNILNSTCKNIEDVSSKVDALAPCASMPIGQNDLFISSAGNYCLKQDVVGTVTVASSYVHIDLNGHSITGGLNGVEVQANVHDVTLANGIIQDSLQEGVLVQGGCARIALRALRVLGCAQNTDRYAIDFVGSLTERISDCSVTDVTISNAPSGLRISNGDANRITAVQVIDLISNTGCSGIVLTSDPTRLAQANVVRNCVISRLASPTSSVSAISVQNTQNTHVSDAKISALTGSSFVLGVFAQNGSGNEFVGCTLHDISSTNAGGFGTGGFLMLAENDCRLQGCSVSAVRALENVGGYGLVGVRGGYVRDCSISDMLTSGVGGFATGYSVSTAGSGVENVQLKNITGQFIQASAGFAVGVGITNGARNVSLIDCSMQDMRGGTQAIGYVAQQCSLVSFKNCSALGMFDPLAASGFVLSEVSCCDLKSCSSNSMSSSSGSAVGYYIINGDKCLFKNCTSLGASSIGGLAAGFFMLSSRAMSFLGCEGSYNDAQNSPVGVFGFVNSGTDDTIYDYCFTQSNSLDAASTGLAYGFNISDSADVQILNSTSLMNDDMAFFVNTSASSCLISNCVGSQSGQGFTDLGMTSTFIENFASFNGSPFSVADNYSGIPLNHIGQLSDPVTVGVNISA